MGSNLSNTQAITKQNAPRRISRFLRPRFSLRTMLAAITIVCLLLGMWIVPSIRQYRAANQIFQLGGTWTFAGEDPQRVARGFRGYSWSPVQGWRRNPPPGYLHFFRSIDDVVVSYEIDPSRPIESWDLLQDLPHLKRLEIRPYTQSNEMTSPASIDLFLQQLSSNPQLTYLNLQRFHIDNRGMAAIGKLAKHLPRLKELKLSPLGVSAKDFAHLAELRKLEDLEISLTPADLDAGLIFLQQMKQLKRLSIFAHVTDDHLKNLSESKDLEFLNLRHAQITDEGLAHLKNLTKLSVLILDRNKIRGPGLKHLQSMQKLEDLSLDGNALLDHTSVEPLLELKSLQTLYLRTTSLSEDDARRLWQLPNIKSIELDLPKP